MRHSTLVTQLLFVSLALTNSLAFPGLTDYSYPQGYKLSFPVRTNYMYGLVRRNVPEMYAFTACLWLKPAENGIGTPFSYAVPEQPNQLVLLQGIHNPAELLINDKVRPAALEEKLHRLRIFFNTSRSQVAQLPLSLPQGIWQHICVSWTLRDGVWKAYQGGKMRGRGEGLSAWHPIKSGGVLVLGQEQVSGTGEYYCAILCLSMCNPPTVLGSGAGHPRWAV